MVESKKSRSKRTKAKTARSGKRRPGSARKSKPRDTAGADTPRRGPRVDTSPENWPRVELRAEKWVQNGFCLAHDDAGRPVFLHGALPGELVRVALVKQRSAHSFAVVTDVLEPSAERGVNDCDAFPACGGCSFRHIPYEEEVALKLELLGEWKQLAPLRDLPGFRFVTAEPDGYRRNVRLQGDGQNRYGFFGLHSNRLVPLPDSGCRQASPKINEAIKSFRASASPTGDPPTGQRVFHDEAGALDWSTGMNAFSQSNRFLVTPWLEAIRDFINEPGDSGEPAAPLDTLELFCGSGMIGGFIREKVGRYKGIDADENGLEAARSNFERNSYKGIFARADLYNRPPVFDSPRVIANPPRAGLGKDLIQSFAGKSSRTKEIIYSSCNPATLNRDLEELVRLGFAVERALAFDFFPRTPHLELLVQLKRDNAK